VYYRAFRADINNIVVVDEISFKDNTVSFSFLKG
jgi:hypothetical protein